MDEFSIIDELKFGYNYNKKSEKYSCSICEKEFYDGEIYTLDGKFYEAKKMIKLHIQKEHGDMFNILLSNDNKYLGMTENQRELLRMIYLGMTDNEIAKKNGVAASTVRHQRFVFREKAKQARMYLALYELAVQSEDNPSALDKASQIVEVHKGAKMVDERYLVTEAEEEDIIKAMFSSLSPLKLKIFSSKEKKKIVILKKIAEQFDKNQHYTEKELNTIIREIFDDYATIRRYMIEYGFMERTNDCKEYWLK